MNHFFLHHRTVRFGECDPAGVVYYPIFFNWFHECMEVWFEEALQTPYAEVIQNIGFLENKGSSRVPNWIWGRRTEGAGLRSRSSAYSI